MTNDSYFWGTALAPLLGELGDVSQIVIPLNGVPLVGLRQKPGPAQMHSGEPFRTVSEPNVCRLPIPGVFP